jgi:hypothetical protein
MQPLDTQFSDSTFLYTQLERQGNVAIYEQKHKRSGVCRYEVVKIHVQREHTWPDGTLTPEKEAYPPASAWGQAGWTFYTLDAAQRHAATLQPPGHTGAAHATD